VPEALLEPSASAGRGDIERSSAPVTTATPALRMVFSPKSLAEYLMALSLLE
jgi:hypothetical protein